MPLIPRERVLMSINHEQPDRVPIIVGTSNTTSMKMSTYQRLKRLINISSEEHYIYDWPELGTALPDEATLQRLHSDARGVLDRFPAWVYERNQNRPQGSPFIDDWKGGQSETSPGVWYPGVHPFQEATTLKEIEDFEWPDMNDPTRVAHVRAQARALHKDTNYAVIGTPWLLFPFERAHAMQGLANFLMNMSLHPDFAEALLLKITDLCKILMGHFLEEAGENIDIIKIGDDLGTQASLMISPKMYRRMLKPMHADFIQFIKQRTNAKVFFHTDGDVFDLIPDFIEIGVDILNPIQTSAGKMSDLPELKKRYGDKLTFCGAVDTHRVLPTGTPAEVRDEVRRVQEILAPGGGYMLAPVHTIMDDVPPENILAMVDAVIEGAPNS
ncbi:MAG: uroporphyrinogen decarboxylase family protein [Chloroflexota bacterium]